MLIMVHVFNAIIIVLNAKDILYVLHVQLDSIYLAIIVLIVHS